MADHHVANHRGGFVTPFFAMALHALAGIGIQLFFLSLTLGTEVARCHHGGALIAHANKEIRLMARQAKFPPTAIPPQKACGLAMHVMAGTAGQIAFPVLRVVIVHFSIGCKPARMTDLAAGLVAVATQFFLTGDQQMRLVRLYALASQVTGLARHGRGVKATTWGRQNPCGGRSKQRDHRYEECKSGLRHAQNPASPASGQ